MRADRCLLSIFLTLVMTATGTAAERPTPYTRAAADLEAATDGGARIVVDPATSRARLIHLRSGALHFRESSIEERADDFLTH